MGTCRKFKDTGVGIGLTRSQNSIRKIGLIWRIGKCLGFKAEASVFAGKEVSAVKLHSRLARFYFKNPATLGIVYNCSRS